MAKRPTKIAATGGNPLQRHWRLAAGALVLGAGLFALTKCGSDEPEAPREPAAATDTETPERVDASQRYFITTTQVQVFRNSQPGAEVVALLPAGACAALPGSAASKEGNQHATTHVLPEGGGEMIRGVSDFSLYRNRTAPITHHSECTAALIEMAADGRELGTSFYIVTNGIQAPPLYIRPDLNGGIAAYIEGCFQTVARNDEFTEILIRTPQGERRGHVQNINGFGVFQTTDGMTADACRGLLHNQRTLTGAAQAAPTGVPSPSEPPAPPPQ